MPEGANSCEQEAGPWGVEIPGGIAKRPEWPGIQDRMKVIKAASAGEHDVKPESAASLLGRPSSYFVLCTCILAFLYL